MKTRLFGTLNLTWALLLAFFAVGLVACDPDDADDDDDGGGDTPIVVEDGMYVIGEGTAVTEYVLNGLMKPTTNEAKENADRPTLLQLYVAIKGGTGVNIVKVAGGEPVKMGPGADFAEVVEDDKIGDEPRGKFWRGSIAETEDKFTAAEDGLYHLVYDTELGTVVFAKVDWGVIGAATPGGWSGSTALTQGAFDVNKLTWETTEMIMLASEYKFRYSDGWKIVLDGEEVRVNTNFGGTLTELVPGGANMTVAEPGVYTVTMTWEMGVGHSAAVEKTGDYTPPTFPEAVYLVGDASAYGWPAEGEWLTDAALMHKCADDANNAGIFWKIAYLEAGNAFKVSEANWGTVNVGFGEVAEFDANGVTVSDNNGNMSVAESGMYMIVLNLQDETTKLSVIAPKVYGIGDAFGSWDAAVEANLFTVDNTAKTITSPALPADGTIRMYTSHDWIAAWWNAEFVVVDGVIEYRNDSDSDPTAVAGTAGQVITLNFDDNTGSIQ